MLRYPHTALVSIYDTQEPEKSFYYKELYALLNERRPEESISHKIMPTRQEHNVFCDSKPYKEWFVIQNSVHQVVGTLYVTNRNEIGISIFVQFRGQKYASSALYNLLEYYPNETFFANVNPENEKSIDLFTKFGFSYIQNTYRREPIVMHETVE